jgi:hypothetical protein
MAGSFKAIVATGRFQTIHLGSLSYLLAARELASEKKSTLYVLTGPLDAELSEHGHRVQSESPRRLMSYEERKFLISLMLSIPQSQILNHRSSPHHGEPGLSIWVESFFLPLTERGILSSEELTNSLWPPAAELAVVIKPSDYKSYRVGGGVVHYTHYLKQRYPNVLITDLNDRLAHGIGLSSLSGSSLDAASSDRAAALPAAMLAAEILIGSGKSLTDPEASAKLLEVFEEFGNSPRAGDAVVKLISSSAAGPIRASRS